MRRKKKVIKLFSCFQLGTDKDYLISELLVKHNANVSAKSNREIQPLHLAAQSGTQKSVWIRIDI